MKGSMDDDGSSESEDEFSGDSALEDSAALESSTEEKQGNQRRDKEVKNQHHDMEFEVSQSMASVDINAGKHGGRKDGTRIANAPHDEEFEVSASQSALDVDMSRVMAQQNQGGKGGPQHPGSLVNQPYDEEMDVSEGEESMDTTVMKDARKKAQAQANAAKQQEARSTVDSTPKAGSSQKVSLNPNMGGGKQGGTGGGGGAGAKQPQQKQAHGSEDESEGESSSSEEEESSSAAVKVEGAYDASAFQLLDVPADVRDLFQYITRFKPQEPELETILKPFIPDYIPTVGEMDAFLKVPRPDGQQDELGLKLLDEPTASQSDATVLELQLRALSKKQYGDVAVRSIEDAYKRPEEIQKWVNSISDLHKSKPPPQVHYKNSMPDIEKLMEIWPDDFEEALNSLDLPGADLDVSVEEYARIICSIMDIPVYENLSESLHILFSLYMEFKSNQHFMGFGAAGGQDQSQMEAQLGF